MKCCQFCHIYSSLKLERSKQRRRWGRCFSTRFQIREKQSGDTRGKEHRKCGCFLLDVRCSWLVQSSFRPQTCQRVGKGRQRFTFRKMWILSFSFGDWRLQLPTSTSFLSWSFHFSRCSHTWGHAAHLSVSPGSIIPLFLSDFFRF